MVSVSNRSTNYKQPRGGYISPKVFSVEDLSDGYILNEKENIHATVAGLVVDYLTRFLNGTRAEDAFQISLLGARNVRAFDAASKLLANIKGLDDESIKNACQLVPFDTAYRVGPQFYDASKVVVPDEATISNIRIMVNRSLDFIAQYGPITKDGFTLEGGYTSIIDSGDGDFLTDNTLWDFKVSKSAPTNKITLQLLIYFLMGKQSTHADFNDIENIGIFNPRLHKVYVLNVASIDPIIIEEVRRDVIGYS